MSVAVGIDLGTTNTVVAAVRDGLAFTIADPQGRRLIPSTVSFHPSGKVLVGHPALERRLIDAENTVFSVKRLIGRSWTSEEVQAARARFAFKMKEGPKQGTIVQARGEEYTLPEISAFVLRYAKATAEAALGVPVDRAVITVPANFNDLQRAATKVAGKLAGLEVLRILNEPTAAALAYGQGAATQGGLAMNERANESAGRATNERVAVYDLGGGTFDVTLLDLSGNVFEVLATAGDTALGGDDFDNLIAERMADEMLKKTRYDARANPQSWGQLRILAESIKRELSSKDEVTTDISDIGFGDAGTQLRWSFRMTRTELEWASLPLVDRTFQTCQAALERASLSVEKVDRVILVGGSTRMPLVGRRVEQFFKKPPVMRVNPDEVVALGAAIQAGSLDRVTRRRTTAAAAQPVKATISEESIVAAPPPGPARPPQRTMPLDDAAMPNLPIVTADSPAPAVSRLREAEPPPARPKTRTQSVIASARTIELDAPTPPAASADVPIDFEAELPAPEPAPPEPSSFGRPLVFDLEVPHATSGAQPALPAPPPNRTQVMPTAQAPELPPTPAAKPPLLIDVTPLSLNVETVGGFCDKLIEGNTPVPCDRTRIFLTASDNQTAVFVRVSQGESVKFAENTFLGELELSGLTPARRGDVQIAVTFEIDADGILNVKAKDPKSGKETTARMHLMGAQTEEHEIAAMQARQARHAVG